MEGQDPDRLNKYFNESLQILQANLTAYRQGCKFCYRVLAVQLRILLCDRKRVHNRWMPNALFNRIDPNLRLHPVTRSFQEDGMYLVDTDLAPIPLSDWLLDPIQLPSRKIVSLGQGIRWVCDRDGGAHVDPEILESDDSVKDQVALEALVVRISEYLLSKLTPDQTRITHDESSG